MIDLFIFLMKLSLRILTFPFVTKYFRLRGLFFFLVC